MARFPATRHRDERDRHGEGRCPQGPGGGFRQLPRFESNAPAFLKELQPDHFVSPPWASPVKPAGVVMAPELWIDVNSQLLRRSERVGGRDGAARDALLKMIACDRADVAPRQRS